MKQYMVSVHHPDVDAYNGVGVSADDMAAIGANVAALNAELDAVGAMVFGAGLMAPDTATVVRSTGDGEVLLTDGPFAETKEVLGGFWILTCADLDEALEWGRKASEALLGGPIEVRACQEEPTEDEADTLHHG